MSPAHVLEPTYRILKRKLMEGVWPPGEKLEALRLADDLGVSMTPVRDCLNRLAGERLVNMHPGEGYRVPDLGEHALREMIELHRLLLEAAIAAHQNCPFVANPATSHAYADRAATLFEALAAQSGNQILAETICALGERMHAVRMVEPKLFDNTNQEIEQLEQCAATGTPNLLSSLRTYSERRYRKVADLVRALRTA